VSVGASLVLALTLMPVMIAGRARQKPAQSGSGTARAARAPSPLVAWLDRTGTQLADLYEGGMHWSLRHPLTVFGVSILVVIGTAYLAVTMPKEILPQVDEGLVVAQLKMPEGTSIEETTRQTARIEAAAASLGARGVYSRVGLATDEELLAGADPGSSATAQLLIPVPDGDPAEVLANGIRSAVPDLAQGHLALDLAGQSEFGSLIGREGRLVRVEIGARTLDDAMIWAERVRAVLDDIPTLIDVRDAYSATQPIIEVELERERLVERGISIAAVSSALAGGLGGVAANEFRETDKRTPIVVRFAGDANEDLQTALQARVAGIPLENLVRWRETRAPLEVVRVNQRPVSVVEAEIGAGGTARATRDVAAALATLDAPGGITWEITGADVEQRRTMNELMLVAVLSVALVVLVLAGEFASFTTPFVVMLTVPLAAAGGIALLAATGQSLNAVSLIGLIVMIGMADNEAIVKLAAIEDLRAQGNSIEESVLRGGRRRLRAITMASLTTVTGVLPLVFGVGSGGELYQPLAAGIIGGTFSTLAVTFFLLPTTYYVVERFKERRATS
jgi:HAE1 family hydrophobic/amphiphilic exporter-1